jgi:uncharacterized membrane protein YeaQ/YmgE (transglycosylase-associated protein family)
MEPAADTALAAAYRSRAPGRPARMLRLNREQGAGKIMPVQSIIVWIIVGLIAGWLAGKVVRGGGFGLIGDIVVGIVGAVIAGYLFPYLGINLGSGFVRAVIDSFIGAVILLIILRLVTGMGKR